MTYDYDVPGTVHLVDIQGVMDVKKEMVILCYALNQVQMLMIP